MVVQAIVAANSQINGDVAVTINGLNWTVPAFISQLQIITGFRPVYQIKFMYEKYVQNLHDVTAEKLLWSLVCFCLRHRL